MNDAPDKLAVLFGDPHSPYIRLDPYFMEHPDDPEAAAALEELVVALEKQITGIARSDEI